MSETPVSGLPGSSVPSCSPEDAMSQGWPQTEQTVTTATSSRVFNCSGKCKVLII